MAVELNTLGEVLRLLRHRSGCSRDELAASSGVSAGAISNYENDVSTPAAPTLRRISRALAAALDTDAEELWAELGSVMDRQYELQQPPAIVAPRRRS